MENLLDQVRRVGAYLNQKLQELVGKFSIATEARGVGMIQALQLNVPGKPMLEGAKDTWAVKAHHADHPGDCFRADNTCAGPTGRWVLVSPPAPDPGDAAAERRGDGSVDGGGPDASAPQRAER